MTIIPGLLTPGSDISPHLAVKTREFFDAWQAKDSVRAWNALGPGAQDQFAFGQTSVEMAIKDLRLVDLFPVAAFRHPKIRLDVVVIHLQSKDGGDLWQWFILTLDDQGVIQRVE